MKIALLKFQVLRKKVIKIVGEGRAEEEGMAVDRNGDEDKGKVGEER
jgi:hypothetical protein